MSKSYYFSTLRGNDHFDGLSPNTPWRSLDKLCQTSLEPGSRILLERNSVFEGETLHLYQVSGSELDPIRIDAYGTGEKLPAIHANGQGRWYQNYGKALDNPLHRWQGWVSSTLLLYDCAFIEVQNLTLTNREINPEADCQSLHAIDRTGVAVVAQNSGTLQHIYLRNLNVRDVDGNIYDKHMNNGGIYFTALMPQDAATGIPRYHHIRIEYCTVDHVARWGIALAYSAYWDQFTSPQISDETAATYGATDVVIRGNTVTDPGGDGITTMYCHRPLIEHNVCRGAGRQINKTDYCHSDFGRVAAGIWPWKCKDALIQYNEVYDTHYHNGENQDGQAFDADWSDGTVYQYNYSHDNEGGCFMICLEEAINTIFRYNISCHDSRGILIPATSPLASVYKNTFILKPGVPLITTNSGTLGRLVLRENTILGSGTQNWYEDTITYENNFFRGFADIPNPHQNTRLDTTSYRSAEEENS